MKETDFRVLITTPKGKKSKPKWDYRVVVIRLTDGMTKTERVSGGWSIANACADRLAREMGMNELATL